MPGVEIAVGWLFAYAARKAKRVAGRADQEVDAALDAGLDRLHTLVTERLGSDAALARLEQEAERGELTDRTRQRVELALADALEEDPAFATAVDEALARLAPASGGNRVRAASGGVAAGRDVRVSAAPGSIAAGTVRGGAHLHPPVPDPSQG